MTVPPLWLQALVTNHAPHGPMAVALAAKGVDAVVNVATAVKAAVNAVLHVMPPPMAAHAKMPSEARMSKTVQPHPSRKTGPQAAVTSRKRHRPMPQLTHR